MSTNVADTSGDYSVNLGNDFVDIGFFNSYDEAYTWAAQRYPADFLGVVLTAAITGPYGPPAPGTLPSSGTTSGLMLVVVGVLLVALLGSGRK